MVAAGRALEVRLLEFDQNWNRTLFAEWTNGIPGTLSETESQVLLELTRIDLERNWSDGNRTTVEDYLAKLPQLGDPDSVPAELLLAEFEARKFAGEDEPFAELARRFPHTSRSTP